MVCDRTQLGPNCIHVVADVAPGDALFIPEGYVHEGSPFAQSRVPSRVCGLLRMSIRCVWIDPVS